MNPSRNQVAPRADRENPAEGWARQERRGPPGGREEQRADVPGVQLRTVSGRAALESRH